MKNSKDYGLKLKKAFQRWVRQAADSKPVVYEDPIEALIIGLISQVYPESEARKIYKRIQNHFVDFNDLRVARSEEILDVMGDHSPQAQETAQVLTRILNQIFDRYDTLTLTSLKGQGKRQGRKAIETLDGISRFAVDYCFLTSLDGHAIPLTETMKNFLRQEELVHPEASDEEIYGFLERQIPAAKDWLFYSLLRTAAEGGLKAEEKRRPLETKGEKKKKAKSKSKEQSSEK